MKRDPLELLRRLYVAGTDVTITGNDLALTGHRPPDDLLEAVRANKVMVVAELYRQEIGHHDDGYPSSTPRQYAVPPRCLSPRLCARIGPCSRFLLRRDCQTDATDTRETSGIRVQESTR